MLLNKTFLFNSAKDIAGYALQRMKMMQLLYG